MSLATGSKLGRYEIVGAIGAGGMGEVYRATDTTLGRQVAIKILPEAFASDPDRLARFEREAKTLASLNHQHIAAIYGVEKSSGTYALVMELVDGEDLAQRLARGAIPVAEALPIAKQIAEALETAHEQGIVHRDLKPANVKVRPDGTVKVLDFGLAKAMDQVPGSGVQVQGSGSGSVGLTNSPTLTSPAMMTGAGMILGTAAYMSPEQAKGRVVDKRSDVWAFGCVLYEMLAGARAFGGDDVTDTLAFVLTREPDWNRLPADTPDGVRRLMRRCLEKDAKRRLRDIGEARILIDNIASGADDPASATTASAVAMRGPSRAAQIAWAGGALLLAVLGVAGGWFARTPTQAEPVAFTVTTPVGNRADAFAISPDGRYIAYAGYDPKDGQQRLWLRAIASTEARVLPGTEAGTMPFWSPDSRTIAFFTGAELKRIDAGGGAVQTIAKVPGPNGGGTWNEQNVIVFSRGNGMGLFKVSATGGEPDAITTLGKGETGHFSPTFLPDGRHFLYLRVATEIANDSVLMWRSLDSGDEHAVRRMYSKAFYSPAGYLVFRLNGPIVAQRFDPAAGTVSGDLIPLLSTTFQNGAQTTLAVSPGVIAHRAGEAATLAQLTWLDRNGKAVGTAGPPGDYRNLVVDANVEGALSNIADPADIWHLDLHRATTSRLTFGPAINSDPVFSPDGKSFAFYSSREPAGIYRKATNGTGGEELITPTGTGSYPRDWSPDGRFLLYDTGPAGTAWVVPLDGSAKPSRFPPDQASASGNVFSIPRFSPDGKWVAYVSTEGGRPQIYVQDFPEARSKFQVSTAGGSEPRWRSDGRELYYLNNDMTMMAVDVQLKPELRLGVPTSLFPTKLSGFINASRRYGVSADGQRFLINVPIGDAGFPPITVVTNWTALLKK